jgi:Zn-dependent protease with chaperone function
MHTLLPFSSLLLTVLAGSVIIRVLSQQDTWSHRRELQLIVLALPLVSLGVGIGALHHFLGQTCLLITPHWDHVLGVALPVAMAAVALGGLGAGLVRLAAIAMSVARHGVPAPADVQRIADRLAEQMGTRRAQVLLCQSAEPLAITYGTRHPVVLLSTWCVTNLDRRELEAVLAHEMGHVARSDAFVVWLAVILRDAFFYLPTSQTACRQLQREKELACDDLAVAATNRPLALASALARTWLQATKRPGHRFAEALVEAHEPIEGRIERLLANPQAGVAPPQRRGRAVAIGLQAVMGLLALTAVSFSAVLTPMGCGLGSVLGRF